MTSWFRSWQGAPTDPKWLVVANKAGVTPGMVSAVVWALFDYASQHDERGSIEDFDVETYAAFSGFEQKQIDQVIKALTDKRLIVKGKLTAWEKRQPRREDNSTSRVTEYRKRTMRHGNDVKRSVTHGNAPEREIDRTERKKDLRAVATATRSPDRFEEFWKAYPKRDGANPKKPALKVFAQSVKSGHDPGAIIAGAERYRGFMRAKGQEGSQYVAQAVTWLRQARWEDEFPSAINGASAADDDYPRIKRMLDTEAERGEWPFVNTPKATIAPEHIARWQAERA